MPPHFTGYVTCNLCSGVCVVMGLSHDKAHDYRQKYGRSTEFTLAMCTPDGVGAFQRPAVFQ